VLVWVVWGVFFFLFLVVTAGRCLFHSPPTSLNVPSSRCPLVIGLRCSRERVMLFPFFVEMNDQV